MRDQRVKAFSRQKKLMLFGLSAAVLVGASWLAPNAREDEPQHRPVPDVRGLAVNDATTTLKRAGFKVRVEVLPSAAGPRDRVYETLPISGFPLSKGREIQVFVPGATP